MTRHELPLDDNSIALIASNLMLAQERLEKAIAVLEQATGIQFRELVKEAEAEVR